MSASQPQVWKGTTFSIERVDGKASGTLIFRLSGPSPPATATACSRP